MEISIKIVGSSNETKVKEYLKFEKKKEVSAAIKKRLLKLYHDEHKLVTDYFSITLLLPHCTCKKKSISFPGI